MKVLVTGATGFIGSAVTRELRDAGHQVVGLARTAEAAKTLGDAGLGVHRGDLSDLDSLAEGAAECDGVVHTAFMRAGTGYASAKAATSYAYFAWADQEAIRAMGQALAGSGRPLIVTSGTFGLTPGRLGTEDDQGDPTAPAGARVASEEATLSLASLGVRSSVVRLPPVVHGDDDRGFLPALIGVARRIGTSDYVGEGLNRWPAVHIRDAAPVFRLALERAEAGSRYHAVGEEAVVFRDIAAVIARRLGINTAARSITEVEVTHGRLGPLIGVDAPASSALTQHRLGWAPNRPGLLTDLDHDRYFNP